MVEQILRDCIVMRVRRARRPQTVMLRSEILAVFDCDLNPPAQHSVLDLQIVVLPECDNSGIVSATQISTDWALLLCRKHKRCE